MVARVAAVAVAVAPTMTAEKMASTATAAVSLRRALESIDTLPFAWTEAMGDGRAPQGSQGEKFILRRPP